MSKGRNLDGPSPLESLTLGQPRRVRARRSASGASEEWSEPILKTGSRGNLEDDLLAGIGAFDVGGKSMGFAGYAANRDLNRRLGSTGAGPDPTYEHRPSSNYEIGTGTGRGGNQLSTTYKTDEVAGDEDILGEPTHREPHDHGRRPRTEFRDEIGDSHAHGVPDHGYLSRDDYFDDTRSSPTVDLGGGRSPVRKRTDSTFARRNLK